MTCNVWGKYRGKIEKLDSFSSPKEARRMAAEYRMAYGSGWTIWAGRKSDDPTAGGAK